MEASGCGHRSDMNLLMTIGGWGGVGYVLLSGRGEIYEVGEIPRGWGGTV